LHELKRRARAKDHRAARLYKVAAYEASLDVLVWTFGTASATVLLIWSVRTNWWLAAIVLVATAWLVVWTKLSTDGWAGSFLALVAPAHARFLSFVQPVLGTVAKWLPPGRRVHLHTGLYEKRDLLEFLTKQNKQVDNRIPEADLHIAFNAIQFGDKSVAQIMTPRRKVKLVGANESIGPLLMDELHKSGFSRFPVIKDSAKTAVPEVIGTLYLNNLIGYEGGGKVKDLASHDVYFINEDVNLRQALGAFLKTHHHLLIVVNSFEEMAGVLSLEDLLEQIIGKQIVDEFDSYQNLRAVAAQDAKKDQAEHTKIKPEQTVETVVE
ncbi:MAG: CBS domain-containing protein, partial [Candidatus Saccharimonadales bacterium]